MTGKIYSSEANSLRRVRLFATPWTVAYQAPLSMGFSKARVLEWVAICFIGKLYIKWLNSCQPF